MAPPVRFNRREWLQQTARTSLGAAAVRLLLSSPLSGTTVARAAVPANGMGRMRVALRPLQLTDDTLVYLKQIGVDDVLVDPDQIPGYASACELNLGQLRATKQRLERHGLRFAALVLDQRVLANFLMGRPGGEEDLDKVCRTIACLGQAEIPLFMYSLLVSRAIFTVTGQPLPGYGENPRGRGGARLKSFDEARARQVTAQPAGRISAAAMWERIEGFMRRCVPVAEKANVVLALHPDDPPVAEHWGVSQVLRTLEGLERAMAIVPSPNNGLLFCQGTIQVAGIDLLDYVRRFGPAGKIVHVELRGARGRVPRFDEEFMDMGDQKLFPLVAALQAIGYAGLVEVAHVPKLQHDPGRFVVDAWSVGYVKGMLGAVKRA